MYIKNVYVYITIHKDMIINTRYYEEYYMKFINIIRGLRYEGNVLIIEDIAKREAACREVVKITSVPRRNYLLVHRK